MRIESLEISKMEQGRPAAVSRPRHRLARRLIYREEIGPADAPTRHAEALGPLDVIAGARPPARSSLRVTVVLDDEDRGESEHGGKIQCLQELPLIGAAVPDEPDRHTARFEALRCQGRSVHQWHAAAHDTVSPHESAIGVGEVHGATLSVTDTPLLRV